MHHALVIVWNVVAINHVPVVFLKIEQSFAFDILSQDAHVFISVRSSLLVMEAQSVAELVSDDSPLQMKESIKFSW